MQNHPARTTGQGGNKRAVKTTKWLLNYYRRQLNGLGLVNGAAPGEKSDHGSG